MLSSAHPPAGCQWTSGKFDHRLHSFTCHWYPGLGEHPNIPYICISHIICILYISTVKIKTHGLFISPDNSLLTFYMKPNLPRFWCIDVLVFLRAEGFLIREFIRSLETKIQGKFFHLDHLVLVLNYFGTFTLIIFLGSDLSWQIFLKWK